MVFLSLVYMNTDPIKNISKISGLYKNLSYTDIYGTSIVIFIVLLIILMGVYGYFKAKINQEPIRNNWAKHRCDPLVIPTAGFIYKPEGKTALAYTGENFQYCLNKMLRPLSSRFTSPFDYLIKGLMAVFAKIRAAIALIRTKIAYIRSKFSAMAKDIYHRLAGFLVPVQEIFIRIRDLFGKVNAILKMGLQSAYGVYMTLQAFVGVVATSSAVALIAGAGVLIALYAGFLLAFFFAPPLAAYILTLAATYTVFYITVMVILVIIIVFMKRVLDVSPNLRVSPPPKGPPPPPKCFDEDTELVLHDNTLTTIGEVNVGDVLQDGSVVTAKLLLDAGEEDMYDLYGVKVSGTHSILFNNEWTLVSKHPCAKKLMDYTRPYIYCLNTTSKRIIIHGIVFADWDEVFGNLEAKLRDTDKDTRIMNNGSFNFIHECFDGGFGDYVHVDMINGSTKPISNIMPGDILKNGVKVYGIVAVERGMIKCRNNIVDTRPPGHLDNTTIHTPLRHLVTDKGFFFAEGKKYSDYNHYMNDIVMDA